MARGGALDLGHLRDLLRASDPTFERLRLGLRAVLGAAVSTWALSVLGTRTGVPSSVWLLGVNLAMASAVLVAEGPLATQRRTSLLLPAVGLAAAALAALADAVPEPLAAGLSLAVIFASVWARRFTPGGVGAGMCAFLTFFVGRYFGLQPAQLAGAAAALAVGGAIAYAVRFGLVRERPERALPGALLAFRLTIAGALHRLEDLLVRGAPPRRLARRLSALGDRLHEAALLVDDRLAAGNGGAPAGGPIGALRDGVFELQLSAERVMQAVEQAVTSGALPPAARRAVAGALRAARAAVRGRAGAAGGIEAGLAEAAELARREGAPPQAAHDLGRLATSLADLATAARWADGALEHGLPPELAAGAAGPGAPGAPPAYGLSHPTRQAIQATVAGALAMAAGYRLSATRWLWAVIAAFVVFARATTVADTVQRAWLRLLGTVLGAGAGLVVALLVEGHPRLELAVVFGCIFLAYWLFRVSYAWMLFWFTLLIAVLYRLMGRFTPALMVLRIEETLVGAGLGALVAAVVLPVRARARVRAATADALRGVADYVDTAVVARAERGEAEDAPVEAARAMEARLRALRATAQPVVGAGGAGGIRSPRAAHLVHATTAAVLHARLLAPGAALAALGPAGRAEVAEAGRRLSASARHTAERLEGHAPPHAPPRPAANAIARAEATLSGAAAVRHGPASPPVWLHWLSRLDQALRDLSAAAGPEPGRPAPARASAREAGAPAVR